VADIEVVVDEREFRAAGEAQRRKLREFAARLRQRPFLGDRIPRRLVPRHFRDLPNLFRLELPGGWRALYTVATAPLAGTQVRVVWIGDHTRYDRLFGHG
jgi:hypothetical protein